MHSPPPSYKIAIISFLSMEMTPKLPETCKTKFRLVKIVAGLRPAPICQNFDKCGRMGGGYYRSLSSPLENLFLACSLLTG